MDSVGNGAANIDLDNVVNVEEVEEVVEQEGAWGGGWKVLTPTMREKGGSLGVVQMRLPPGHSSCPFHWHTREDEVFYVLRGRGVLRYGEALRELSPGDCVSCPAGTKVAHQIANPFDEDLVYLAIGPYDRHEVCGYPDSGKVLVRALSQVGLLESRPYMAGEPEPPRIFGLWRDRG